MTTTASDPEDDGFGKPEGRWEPDAQLLPALLAGSTNVRYADMTRGDRAWAIAGLRRAGITAEAIAEQLVCSLRQVRAVAAEPAAILARFFMDEAEVFDNTLRMERGEVARLDRERAEAEADRDRYLGQLRHMIDAAMTGEIGPSFPKCGHPKTWGNTYTAPKTGKTSCRMCHAEAQAEYRERQKAATPEADTGDHGTRCPRPQGTTSEVARSNVDNHDTARREPTMTALVTPKHVSELLSGKAPLSATVALGLERVTGTPARVWNRFEAGYREDLARLAEEDKLKPEDQQRR